ncbi:MAG: hypothetical protein ACOYEW_00990 [Anaerolineae bacterium]|jgi:hypothetical protein
MARNTAWATDRAKLRMALEGIDEDHGIQPNQAGFSKSFLQGS